MIIRGKKWSVDQRHNFFMKYYYGIKIENLKSVGFYKNSIILNDSHSKKSVLFEFWFIMRNLRRLFSMENKLKESLLNSFPNGKISIEDQSKFHSWGPNSHF